MSKFGSKEPEDTSVAQGPNFAIIRGTSARHFRFAFSPDLLRSRRPFSAFPAMQALSCPRCTSGVDEFTTLPSTAPFVPSDTHQVQSNVYVALLHCRRIAR
jgi:hypothetical protein